MGMGKLMLSFKNSSALFKRGILQNKIRKEGM